MNGGLCGRFHLSMEVVGGWVLDDWVVGGLFNVVGVLIVRSCGGILWCGGFVFTGWGLGVADLGGVLVVCLFGGGFLRSRLWLVVLWRRLMSWFY